MKVLYSHYSFGYSGMDGFAARLFQLLKGFTSLELEIVTSADLSAYHYAVTSFGNVHILPIRGKAYVAELKKVVRETQPDVFIATSPYDLFAAQALDPKLPIWFWVHGVTEVWDWMADLVEALDGELIYLNPSQFAERNGIHKGQHWVSASECQFAENFTPKLLYYGRFDKVNKQCHLALDLLDLLEKKGLTCTLDFVGNGFENLTDRPNVHIQPPVSPFVRPDWLASFDFILSFSKHECFPLGVLDAVSQACVPVFFDAKPNAFFYLKTCPFGFQASANLSEMADQILEFKRSPKKKGAIASYFQEMYSEQKTRKFLEDLLALERLRKPDAEFFDKVWRRYVKHARLDW